MSDITQDGLTDNEPSMEDILASIRKIIADDDDNAPAATPKRKLFSGKRGFGLLPEAPDSDDLVNASDTASDTGLNERLDSVEFTDFDTDTLSESLDLTRNHGADEDTIDFDLTEALTLDLPGDDTAAAQLTDLAEDESASDFLDMDLAAEDDILDLTENLVMSPIDTDDGAVVDTDNSFDEDFDLVLREFEGDDLLSDDGDVADETGDLTALNPEPLSEPASAISIPDDEIDFEAFLDDDFDDIPAAETVIDPAADLLEADGPEDENVSEIDDIFSDEELDAVFAEADEDAQLTESLLADFEDDLAEDISGDGAVETAATSPDADIELVKSLMAELTEDDPVQSANTFTADGPMGTDAALDDDEINFDDMLDDVMSSESLSPVTGVAATHAARLGDDGGDDYISDDLASIVAQSSAEIDAAKQDALLAQDATETIEAESLVEEIDLGEDADLIEAELPLELSASDIIDVDDTEDAADIAPSVTDDDFTIPDAALGKLSAAAAAVGTAAIIGSAASESLKGDGKTSTSEMIEDVEPLNFDELLSSTAKVEIPDDSLTDSLDIDEYVLSSDPDLTPDFLPEDPDMPHIVKSDAILSGDTAEQASGAFASLSQAVEEKTVFEESGPRIGDLVQEALKPMLQTWLDENLKGIVDRAVAKEIKRISSGK